MVDPPTNAAAGQGPHFVTEADEFDSAFLHYRPHIAVVTNVEPDHLDYYGSFERVKEAFRQFLLRVSPSGYIVACGNDPALQGIIAQPLAASVVSYGLGENFHWWAEKLSRKSVGGYTFVVKCRQGFFGTFETQLPGVHNVSNSLAAIAVGSILGLPKEAIQEAVSQFRGVRRRFELLGRAGGVTVMDDYAHHPTEIRATLAAARERFPQGRLVCLFQPHTYSRTRYLLKGFRTCFGGAHLLLIAETYAAREEPSAGMSARELAAAIERPPAHYVGSLEQAAQAVLQVLQPGDIFFTIGAGDVNKVAHMTLQELQRR